MDRPSQATRRIEIDAGHRIPNHHSQCRRLHGHRYVIEMTCEGRLIDKGSSEGMVMDFGFMKELMMKEIHEVHDHRTMLHITDPLVNILLKVENTGIMDSFVLLPIIPTAENLAVHWYHILSAAVFKRPELLVNVTNVRVYETPNCWADFPLGTTELGR